MAGKVKANKALRTNTGRTQPAAKKIATKAASKPGRMATRAGRRDVGGPRQARAAASRTQARPAHPGGDAVRCVRREVERAVLRAAWTRVDRGHQLIQGARQTAVLRTAAPSSPCFLRARA